MRTAMFKKAAKLILEGKVEKDLEGDKRTFFKVKPSTPQIEDHSVILEYVDYVLQTSCTCAQMHHKEPKNLCSHKIAAVYYLVDEHMQKLQAAAAKEVCPVCGEDECEHSE